MKKIAYALMFLFVFCFSNFYSNAQSPCSAVSVEVIEASSQSGQFKNWGIRVFITQPYHDDITVEGTIEGGFAELWTLTIPAGNTSAQTSDNYYQTDPVTTAVATITNVSACPTVSINNPGEIHNTIMNDLLNGNYIGSGNLLGYMNTISNAVFGYTLNLNQTMLENLKNNSIAGNAKGTLNNYSNAGLVTSNLSTISHQLLDHLDTWSDDLVTPEVFNQNIDNFILSQNVDQSVSQAYFNAIDILKKSYEYHYYDTEERPEAIDNPRQSTRCRGFWRKLCIISTDFVAAVGGNIFGPAGAVIFAGLYSAASSCCGICCPATQGCLDSQLCCITFIIGCGT